MHRHKTHKNLQNDFEGGNDMTKTNTRSRIVSILLVLMMLLTMVPITAVTANAAEWTTVNSYEELQTAINNKKEYIQLGRNIDTKDFHYSGGGLDIADWLTFENQTCTLDLNGKTLSLLTRMGDMPTFMRVYEGSNLTIKDSQGGGQITGEFENTGAGDRYLIHMNQSSLTLEGGTFRATAKPYGTNINVIDYLESNVTIKDGVTISQPKHYAYGGGGSALKGRGYALCEQEREFNYGDEVSHVVIDGGIFDGWVRLIGYPDTNGSVQINGGTFKKGVQALYVAKKNNSDPTVTVNGGTFEGNVYLQDWDWKESLYMPYRLNGGTFKGTVDLHAVNNITVYQKPESNPNVALGLNECFGYSAVVTPDGTFAGPNAYTGVLKKTGDYDYDMWLKGTASNPVRIIPNAWGITDVTLDGKKIDYAKDWKGAAVEITNDTAHTIKFTWKSLNPALSGAGYSYNATCDRYVSGSSTPTPDTISNTDTEYSFTIDKDAPAKVYSFDLHLNLKKDDSPYNIGIIGNEHIVKLVVSDAPPEPPAPVAHSITITNTHGTATPATAIAGETVTVKADDRTGYSQMFTQWYTKTAGVTFADVTKQETTFVMLDRDVQVYPGYQYVSFTKQPIDSWPQVNHGSKATVTFSAPITKWELKEGNTTVASSGNLFINTGNPITVDIPAQSSAVEKTYTVVVTANGQKFSSNEFKVKWVNWPQAPAVEFTPADGTQFVGEIDVTVSDALYAGEEIFEIAYTTDGTDPKTSTTTIYANTDTNHITLTETTTIKARTYNHDASADAEKWGPLATATFTKYSDTTLPKPTITPEGTTYTGSITAYLTAPALDGVKMEYCLMRTGDPDIPDRWETYDPETGITVNDFGSITLYARTFKNVDAETPDGLYYVEHLTSENVSATYTRTYSAAIDNVTVGGKVGKTLTQDVVIRMNGDRFENVTAGDDVSAWFNLPAGLSAKVKELSEADGYHRTLTVTISGKPTATSAAAITVTIPKDKLYANNTADLTVLSNPNAYYSIALDADHQHDYTGQPYLYLDPGNHYQECTAGDGYNIQAHEFTPWTDNENGTHSRHCTVCKMTDGSTYTETAEHTWVWVVDQEAALGQPGKQHEECTGCHAKRNENTDIPALRDYAVTVTGGTATVAAGTTITRAMEGVEVTVTAQAPDGKHFVKWVVKAGGITLANETSATTTFTMPANDVTIEAEFAENPVEAYTLTVITGTASVAAGTPITDKIEQNTVVTITADAPETGKVFDKWVVLEGNVTLADATKATTTFTMPASAVKIEATYKDAPPSHTHSYGTDWKYDDNNHWHECACGDKADIAAHSASEWIVDTAATETADGAKHKECTVCKKVLETAPIPATGSTHTHSYGTDWKYDDINHWHECECGDKADTAAHSFRWVIDKAATKEATGIKHEECTVCGAKRSENTVIPKDSGSPQTGDSSNLIGWLAALFVSGGVLTALGLNGKKRKESEAE